MLSVAMVGFLVVVGFVVGSIVWAIERIPDEARAASGRVARRPRFYAVLWLGVSAAPALLGVLQPAGPVPPQIVMVVVFAAAMWFSMSSIGGALAAATALFLLVGFQAFRLPLELVLHEWALSGVAPPQMTWTGSNIDIVAGAVALASVPVVRRWPRFAWVPTIVGLALLANIFRIVALSLPGVLMAYPDPITLPNRFPHVWIATVCVGAALAGHVIAMRAMSRVSPPTAPSA